MSISPDLDISSIIKHNLLGMFPGLKTEGSPIAIQQTFLAITMLPVQLEVYACFSNLFKASYEKKKASCKEKKKNRNYRVFPMLLSGMKIRDYLFSRFNVDRLRYRGFGPSGWNRTGDTVVQYELFMYQPKQRISSRRVIAFEDRYDSVREWLHTQFRSFRMSEDVMLDIVWFYYASFFYHSMKVLYPGQSATEYIVHSGMTLITDDDEDD